MIDTAKRLFQKKEDYLFGTELTDKKTDRIFSIINKLIRVVEFQTCKKEIHSIFFKLVHFYDSCLKNAELILTEKKLTNILNKQKVLNQEFIEQIIEFQNNYKEGKDNLCRNLLDYITEWVDKQKELDKLLIDNIKK